MGRDNPVFSYEVADNDLPPLIISDWCVSQMVVANTFNQLQWKMHKLSLQGFVSVSLPMKSEKDGRYYANMSRPH